MKLRRCSAYLLLTIANTVHCQASSIAIMNAGFEDPPLALGGFTSNTIPGWTGAPPIGVQLALDGNPLLGRQLAIRLSQIVLLPNPDPLVPVADYDDIQLLGLDRPTKRGRPTGGR